MEKIQLTEKSYICMENGKVHNPDGPAWVHENGMVEYFIEGKLHREDGPARIMPDGTQELWFHGEYQGKTTPDGIFHPWKV